MDSQIDRDGIENIMLTVQKHIVGKLDWDRDIQPVIDLYKLDGWECSSVALYDAHKPEFDLTFYFVMKEVE